MIASIITLHGSTRAIYRSSSSPSPPSHAYIVPDSSYHRETICVQVTESKEAYLRRDEDQEEEDMYYDQGYLFRPVRSSCEYGCRWSGLPSLLSHLIHVRQLKIIVKCNAIDIPDEEDEEITSNIIQCGNTKYQKLSVKYAQETIHDVCHRNHVMAHGDIFYQLGSNMEDISANESLICYSHKDKTWLDQADQVRDMLGWKNGPIKQNQTKGYTVWIQSTSTNRGLVAGTHILVKSEGDDENKNWEDKQWSALLSLPHLHSLEIIDEQLYLAAAKEERDDCPDGSFRVPSSILSHPQLIHLRLVCAMSPVSCAGLDWCLAATSTDPRHNNNNVCKLRALRMERMFGKYTEWSDRKEEMAIKAVDNDDISPSILQLSRIERMSHFPELRILELSLPYYMRSTGLAELEEEIKLWTNYFEFLSGLVSLRYLSLHSYNVNDCTLVTISTLPHLIILRFLADHHVQQLTSQGIKALSKLHTLQCIHAEQLNTCNQSNADPWDTQNHNDWGSALSTLPSLSYLSFDSVSSCDVSWISSLITATGGRLLGIRSNNITFQPKKNPFLCDNTSQWTHDDHYHSRHPSIVPALCSIQPISFLADMGGTPSAADHDARYAMRHLSWLNEFRQVDTFMEYLPYHHQDDDDEEMENDD